MILLTGILCAMSLAVCACSGEKETSGQQQTGTNASEPENAASTTEPSADSTKDDSDTEPSADAAGDGEGAKEGQADADAPDLEGDIKELQDGKLTLVKHETSETDDGFLMVVAPGEDDSGFEKVTVTYDEKTVFWFWNIYDGGARSETKEATAADLEKGRSVQVWGGMSDGEMKATQIRIVQVV